MAENRKPIEVSVLLKDLFTATARAVGAAAKGLGTELKAEDAAATKAGAGLAAAKDAARGLGDASKTAEGGVKALTTDVKALGTETQKTTTAMTVFKAAGTAVGAGLKGIAAGAKSVFDQLFGLKALLIGFGAAFVGGRIVGGILSTAEALDNLNAASRRTGVAVEDLSKLRIAAKLANVEFDTLTRALGIFNRIRARNSPAAREAFGLLGLDAEAVRNAKSVSDLLPDIAEGLAKLSNARQASVLNTLFGRSGIELLTVFEGGATKLRESLKIAEEFNLVLTKSQVDQADKLTDAVDLVRFAWEKVKASFIEAMGPNATGLLKNFARLLAGIPEQARVIGAALGAIGGGTASPELTANIAQLTQRVGQLFGDVAIATGKTIAVTFINVLKIGLATLVPAFEALFRDAIAPALNEAVGFTLVEQSPAGQMKRLGEEFGEATRALIAARKAMQDSDDLHTLLGAGVQGGNPEALRAFQDNFDKRDRLVRDLKEAQEVFDALNTSLDAKLAVLREKMAAQNQQIGRDMADAFDEAGPNIKRAADDAFGPVADDLAEIRALMKAIQDEVPNVATSLTTMHSMMAAMDAERAKRDAVSPPPSGFKGGFLEGAFGEQGEDGKRDTETYDRYAEGIAAAQTAVMGLRDSIAGPLAASLEGVLSGTMSLKDGFNSFWRSALEGIARLILQLLVMQAVVLGLRALGVVTPLNTGGLVGGLNKGGTVRGYAGGGGILPDDGGPDRDRVLASLTPGEFVQPRQRVRDYGVDVMEGIRRGVIPRDRLRALLPSSSAAPKGYNEGGSVSGPGGGRGPETVVQPVLVASERAMAALLSEGKSEMIRFLRDNRRQFS